jgi:dolichol-phosphate mannosyltransferase
MIKIKLSIKKFCQLANASERFVSTSRLLAAIHPQAEMKSPAWDLDMHQPPHWARLTSSPALALIVDVLIFYGLSATAFTAVTANLLSFSLGTFLGYLPITRGKFADTSSVDHLPGRVLCGRFVIIFVLAFCFRGILFRHLFETSYWEAEAAILVAAFAGHLVQFFAVVAVVLAQASWITPSANLWRRLAIVVVAYTVAFRVAAMGPVNLIPEEAYYWNYAQHLDLSYLDHPPMVAWLIWVSTSLFGKSEFSVRLPALISWAFAAGFMFGLTAHVFDKNTAFRCLLLMAVLPFYFGFGFFMTPDAPLFAAWAGCLFYLYRALIGESRSAWWGASVCMGLGLLSKYTILLLAFATVGFLLADRRSRHWWVRAEPYFATLLSAIIFLPVLIWNARQGWASFAFQGSRRWSDEFDFSLLLFMGSILLALTPVGVATAAQTLLSPPAAITAPERQPPEYRRQWLFGSMFTLVPLSVFLLFSFFYELKINWTAPVLLAIVPWVAKNMGPEVQPTGKIFRLLQRLWVPTLVAILLTIGAGFYYVYLALPWAGPMAVGRLFGPWKMLGMKVDAIQRQVEIETGARPLVIGMDRYLITSELAFYDQLDGDRFKNAGGTHFFGGKGLMWEYWFPSSSQIGRTIILVDLRAERLAQRPYHEFFERITDIFTETLEIDGRTVGQLYWRIGYGYRGEPPPANNLPD